MRDRPVIYCGLLLFAGFLTLPIWHNLAAHVTAKGPQPVLPAHEKQCVAPLDYMKTSHMDLLFAWRASVVRQGGHDFTTFDGRHYNMSLTKTCLQCHGPKAQFCDRCHDYAAVSPPCWNCHLDANPVLRSAR